jgi:hypothetical protein
VTSNGNGGVFINSNVNATISNITLSNNGSGIVVGSGGDINNTVTVTSSTFSNNTNDGILFNAQSTTVTVSLSTFTSNTDFGIDNEVLATNRSLIVNRSSFSNNGGGIDYRGNGTGGATISNSTFSGNSGDGVGCSPGETCLVNLQHVTAYGNGGNGFNIQGTNSASVSDSVFVGNAGDMSGCANTMTGLSILSDASCGTNTITGQSAAAVINTTLTGVPAFHAVIPAGPANGAAVGCSGTSQNGVGRSTPCDIGAAEG